MKFPTVDYLCEICLSKSWWKSDQSVILAKCYEIQYMWTARSTDTETETGLDRYVMLGARWLTEY